MTKDEEAKGQKQKAQSNSKVLMIVVISVLVTVIATGSVVYFWQRSTNEKVINDLKQKVTSLEKQISNIRNEKKTPGPKPRISLDPTSILEPTEGWKTYSNNSNLYQFTFKYPNEIKILHDVTDGSYGSGIELGIKEDKGTTVVLTFIAERPKTKVENLRYEYEALDNLSIGETFVNDYFENYQEYPRSFQRESDVKIGNLQVKHYTRLENDRNFYYLAHNDIRVKIFPSNDNELLINKILSTFQFTN